MGPPAAVPGNRDAKVQVASAGRWVEVRAGELLGPAEAGGDHGNQYTGGRSNALDVPLSPDERVWFRRLAAHVPVVAECAADVTGHPGRRAR